MQVFWAPPVSITDCFEVNNENMAKGTHGIPNEHKEIRKWKLQGFRF